MLDSMKDRLRRPSAGTVIGTVALVAALGGGAYAAIPGGDGTINGCYATTDGLLLGIPHSKGDLRTIEETEGCRPYERPVSWSQRGPQGPAGPGPAVIARINGDGTVDAARSTGITNANVYRLGGNREVDGELVSTYCVHGLADPKVIMVTAEHERSFSRATVAVQRTKPRDRGLPVCDDADFNFAVNVGTIFSYNSAVDLIVY